MHTWRYLHQWQGKEPLTQDRQLQGEGSEPEAPLLFLELPQGLYMGCSELLYCYPPVLPSSSLHGLLPTPMPANSTF